MSDIPDYWNLVSRTSVPEGIKKSNKLSGYSSVSLSILFNRGLKTADDMLKFLKNFSFRELHDPFLIPDIVPAVKRLLKAIKKKEKILIFGDYDADGIISAHIIADFLKKCAVVPEVYIPDRIEEGYDINVEFVKKLKKNSPDISLIICVDCGTNSVEVMKMLSHQEGYPDLIVADHHKMNDPAYDLYNNYFKNKGSDKYLIINPQLIDSSYPFKDISGALVSFKLVNAALLEMTAGEKKSFKKNYLTSFIDLLAISTVADLMPLLDENRVLVKWGLEQMKRTKNKGLKLLLEKVLPRKTSYTTYDLGFVVGPRLNAAGRIKHGRCSYDLLDNDNKSHEEILDRLNAFNEKRKEIQEKTLNKILTGNEHDFKDIKNNKKIFIAKSPEWHEGLIGIISSDLVKELRIPVILFVEKPDCLKGSGRSIEGFDLFGHLNKISYMFSKFGGHKMACGITLKAENQKNNNIDLVFEKFKRKMEEIAQIHITDKQIQPNYQYECEIGFADINAGLYNEFKEMEPFGIGNPKPVLLTKKCRIKEIKFFKEKKHASLLLEESGFLYRALKFNLDLQTLDKYDRLSIDDDVSVLYYIDENFYNGISCLQLILVDLFLN